jgi:5'-3' exoribonuclease 2
VPIDPQLSKGINGSVLPNPDCIPGSTYYSPLPTQDEPDIKNDRSLTALYFFPKQLTPHRSVLLPGVKRPARQLSWADTNATQRYVDHNGGGRGRGGYDQRGRGGGRGNSMFHNNSNPHYNNDRSYGNGNSSYQPAPYQQRHPYQSQQGYSGYNSGARPSSNYGGATYNSRGSPPGRGAPPLNSQYNSHGGPRGGSYGSEQWSVSRRLWQLWQAMDEVVTVVTAVMGRHQMVMVATEVAEAHTMTPEAEVGVDIDTGNLITRC